ncbi:phenoloxidase-activating factor 1-like [Diabrotica virgifera virgifera]|uniref:CLIP domain-containing serine protease n=1 Tax=Diabrotica virgifera virgifera TaxID=50390 RepID=A0ABM5ILC4_DIAVI|nr:phenoloxidase-activating factor 1-like [Diabrotica virgifera virgifera]
MIVRLKLLCLFFLCIVNVFSGSNFTIINNATTNSAISAVFNESTRTVISTNAVTNLSVSLRLPTECGTPNGDPGWCLEIQDCPLLLKQITNIDARPFLLASRCGPPNEDSRRPKVCCGKYDKYQDPSLDEINIFPKRCGHQKHIMQSRILGGTTASIGEFPWMIRLVHQNDRGYKTFGCTGFLIHTKYVLTAAHCVHGKFIQFRGPVFLVQMGEHNTETKIDCSSIGTNCADPLQISRVGQVIVHHGYDVDSPGHYNDIALIHLKKAARITEFVTPICLQMDNVVPNRYYISGWGKTETEAFSKIKMKLEIPPYGRVQCVEKYSIVSIEVAESQICAGGEDRKDSCTGDSGGPLMFENGTHWMAAGIVSYGLGCGTEDWPGIYTNVSHFLPWIKEKIFENSLVNTKNPNKGVKISNRNKPGQ